MKFLSLNRLKSMVMHTFPNYYMEKHNSMTKAIITPPRILLTKAEHQAENWFHSSIKENQP